MMGSMPSSCCMVSSRLLRHVFGDDASLTNRVTPPADSFVVCGRLGNLLRADDNAVVLSALSVYARKVLLRSLSAEPLAERGLVAARPAMSA